MALAEFANVVRLNSGPPPAVSPGSVDHILATIRLHLGMDVAFVSHIASGHVRICNADAVTNAPIHVGDTGLSLAEGKKLLSVAQRRIVEAQTAAWVEGRRCCDDCGRRAILKGRHPIVYHTLFGDVALASPRFHRCRCRGNIGAATNSPLVTIIPHHVAPERLYLEARWASLVPYAAAAELLADVLPIATGANATTVRQHVLRVTVLGQFVKGVAHLDTLAGAQLEDLARIKWKLWHGNSIEALELIDRFENDVSDIGVDYPNLRKFEALAREFGVYIASNTESLINYGERYRSGERISSAFVEATVNAVISKRFAKKQQMQWTRNGAHLLMQTRTRTLDGTLRSAFERWYPGMANDNADQARQAQVT